MNIKDKKFIINRYFIALGVFAVLLIVSFFSYKTLTNYQDLIEKSQLIDQGLQTASSSFSKEIKEGDTEEQKIINELGTDSDLRTIMPKALEGKLIVIIIAFKDFRDAEYFGIKQTLQAAGGSVLTASVSPGTARGADGGEAQVNLLEKDIKVSDYDAIIFIGGPGALHDLDNEISYSIIRQAISNRKILGAICVTPAILAEAGGLRGKNATVWSSEADKSAIKTLQDNGAVYQDKPVVADGNIITGNGPAASEEFAMKIIELLP